MPKNTNYVPNASLLFCLLFHHAYTYHHQQSTPGSISEERTT